MRHRKRLLSLIAGVALVGALPSIAVANTTEAIAETGGMTLTLPGVPLTLGITLDPFGNIQEVTIDPTFAPDHESDHKVTFERASDGSTVVKAKASGEKLTAKVKTSNLDEFVGTQTWSADVFGTGTASTVTFTIAKVGTGDSAYLEITGPPVVTPVPGIDSEVSGPTTDSDDHDGDEWEYESKAYVNFFMDGFKKSLKIEIETEYENDDDHEGVRAKLKVELRGKDVQNLEGAIVEGPQSWTGLLCDGSTALVEYTVAADGTVSEPIVTVAGDVVYETDMDDDGFKIQFTDSNGDDGAYVKVDVKDENGSLALEVKSKTTASCGDDDHDDDGKDKDHDDDGKDKDHDDDGKDEDQDDDDHDKNKDDDHDKDDDNDKNKDKDHDKDDDNDTDKNDDKDDDGDDD